MKETRIPQAWISKEDYEHLKKHHWIPEAYVSSYPTGSETVPIYFGPEDDNEAAVERWAASRGVE